MSATFPALWGDWNSPEDARWDVATHTTITTEYTVENEREFHTWREAVLQALDTAALFTTVGKPRVHWRYDRWVVSHVYRPVLMNGTT